MIKEIPLPKNSEDILYTSFAVSSPLKAASAIVLAVILGKSSKLLQKATFSPI